MLNRPAFHLLHQIASDSGPSKSLINDQTGNLDSIIRFQKLRENRVNPAYQSVSGGLGHKNNVAGTIQQSPKPPPHHVIGRRITKLPGKPRDFCGILLACAAYRIARHRKRSGVVIPGSRRRAGGPRDGAPYVFGDLFPHRHAVLNFIAELAIKRLNPFVLLQDLEVNFRAPQESEPFLRVTHKPGPKTTTAILRQHSQGVYPTAVSVVSSHYSAYNLALDLGNKEQSVTYRQLLVDRQLRSVVRTVICKNALPKPGDLSSVPLCVKRKDALLHA